jgi:uncharacterized membrane protein
MPAPVTRWMGTIPDTLRDEILGDPRAHMRLRRAAAAVNLLGIAMMSLTTLLQMGIVRRLPDPPLRRFDTKKVNSSAEAYSYGGPDSPINVLAHSVNLVLAATGGPDRAHTHPWLPVLAAAVELPQSVVAAKYLFHQMPYVDDAWCPYCITDALTHFATMALVLPEAIEAARNFADGSRG